MSCVVPGCRWEPSTLPYRLSLELTDPDSGEAWGMDLELEACPEHARELHEAQRAIANASSQVYVRGHQDLSDDDVDDEDLSDEFYELTAPSEEDLEAEAMAYGDELEEEVPF